LRTGTLATLGLAILTLSACATTGDAPGWSCTAKNLVTARYGGGTHAYVQLQGYATGSQYSVKLNEQKTEATGTTGDGTPFVCRRST
jgi:hypothetical protein